MDTGDNTKKEGYGSANNKDAKYYYSGHDYMHSVSIIEVQTNRTKRLWLKVIAFFVAFVFLFQQLGIADIYSYKRAGGVAEEVLPDSREHDRMGRMGPKNLMRAQQKHEDLVRQRTGTEEMVGQLMRGPKEEEEDMPLKKKQSGGGGGGRTEYTLTEPDDLIDPHLFNDLEYNQDVLSQIDTYDITRHPPINIDTWKASAKQEKDEETGLDYWVGYEDEDGPLDDRKIKEAVYLGGKGEEKIDHVLSGYVQDPASGTYQPKYRTDYEYAGDAISRTLKYYIWNDQEILVEEALFEGDKENNKVTRKVNYNKETGKATSCEDFYYEDDDVTKALRKLTSYDTKDIEWDINSDGVLDADEDLDGDGKLGADFDTDGDGIIDDVDGDGIIGQSRRITSITYFVGENEKEVADYTVNMDKDGDITSTIINYYRGGNRAEDADYRDPKGRVVTYRYEVDPDAADADGDSIFDGYLDSLSSIAYYDIEHRLPGEEVLNFTETYANGSVIQSTVYYYGEAELRASEANYRDPMSKSVTYWGDAVDEIGNIAADAKEKSATYYYIEGRLKGEETADYTIRRNTREEITGTTIYYYEGDKRASESEAIDRMSKSVMYRGEVNPEALDADDDGILDGYESQLASITYFHYEGREKGKEVTDYTVKYNSRQEIVSTTISLYEVGLLRASEAGSDDCMSRSVTYRGTVDAPDLALDLFDADGNPGEDGIVDGYDTDGDDTTIEIACVYSTATGELIGYEMGATFYEGKLLDYAVDLIDIDGNPGRDGVIDGIDFDGDGVIDMLLDAELASVTYFHFDAREKGEEVSDYTEKFNSNLDITNTTVYLYESDLKRAQAAGAYDRMSRSVTYRGELLGMPNDALDIDGDGIIDGADTDGDGVIDIFLTGALSSITYYDYADRTKGEEVTDYTEKYNSSQQVTNTTVYLYESDLRRAKEASAEDRTSRSVTYRGEIDATIEDVDGDGILDLVDEDLNGNGILDDGEDINGDGNLDVDEDVDNDGHLDGLDVNGDGILDDYQDKLASITYNNLKDSNGVARLKGEEVTDYTEKYNSNQQVTTTTVYLYEDVLARAQDADSYDRMSRNVTYRGELLGMPSDALDTDGDGIIDGADTDGDGAIDMLLEGGLSSITYFDYDSRLKGEEVTDYTEKYNSSQIVTNTTIYLYESDLKRASEASAEDRTSRSVTYRRRLDDLQAVDADGDGIIDAYMDKLASITYNNIQHSSGIARLKGEEITDYTEKYDSNQNITNTTVYLYESGLNRARDAGADDRMSRSVTYRGELLGMPDDALDTDDDGIIDGADTDGDGAIDMLLEGGLSSITYYDYAERMKGEEVTDYSEKYNSSQDITNMTVYLYESDLKRAKYAGADDRMSRSITYRDEVDTTIEDINGNGVLDDGEDLDSDGHLDGLDTDNDGILDDYENEVSSITYYDYADRIKGEEVTDYTEKYDSKGEVTNTTVYLYEESLKRAMAAGADDCMSRSVTYRGVIDPTVEDADNNGILDAYESDVSSITYYDYTDRIKGEEVTDYSENFNSKDTLTQTTVYLYGDDLLLLRASEAGPNDVMCRSVAYHEAIDASEVDDVKIDDSPGKDGIIDSEEDKLASVTYYNYTDRLKGEEVVDLIERYGADNVITGTTVYYYEAGNLRADQAREDDRNSKTVNYRGEVTHDAVTGANGYLVG
ncbi:MAG: hypothetical protein WBB66_05070, partial [Candidatus Omnitrophota bacterium]